MISRTLPQGHRRVQRPRKPRQSKKTSAIDAVMSECADLEMKIIRHGKANILQKLPSIFDSLRAIDAHTDRVYQQYFFDLWRSRCSRDRSLPPAPDPEDDLVGDVVRQLRAIKALNDEYCKK